MARFLLFRGRIDSSDIVTILLSRTGGTAIRPEGMCRCHQSTLKYLEVRLGTRRPVFPSPMGFGEECVVRDACRSISSASRFAVAPFYTCAIHTHHPLQKSYSLSAHQVKEGKCTVALNRQEQNLWELWVFSLG